MDRDLRDMTLVIVFSIVGVAIIMWFAAHGGGPSKEAVGKWSGFIATTGIVFGLAMKYRYKSSKRRFSFARLVGSLLVLHLVVGIWVLSTVTNWAMAWWAPITVLESVALDLVLRGTGHGSAGADSLK